MGEISPKRVMGRTSSTRSTYDPGRSVAIVRNNRVLLKVLMDAAIAAMPSAMLAHSTIQSHEKHRNGRLTAGAVVVLHPFSRSMGFNPHLHILATVGGFYRHDNFIRQAYIPYGFCEKHGNVFGAAAQ
ncbi:MAG: hypothetical protein C4B59_08325 [Candidatus Methanogaster sp.]|uniref:Uncharacterized protein n=1 Tax=Candidatus Methanogaster sp. TaxID=3386292 RepID=A0AC61L2Q9_9EURY|nr:MAG: hypothetical protein C4B59_08325 [ANME-2 cluster archaeon]